MRTCPICASKNDDDRAFCTACGSSLNPDNARNETFPPPIPSVLPGYSPDAPVAPKSWESPEFAHSEIAQASPFQQPPSFDATQPNFAPPAQGQAFGPTPGQAPGYAPGGFPPAGYPNAGYQQMYPQNTPPPKTNGLAIASLICSVLGCFGITAIAGVILGHVSLSQIKKSNGSETGRGLAIAGLIVGYIFLALSILVIIAFINAVNNGISSLETANFSAAT